MSNYRVHRIGEQIRDLISEMLIRKIKDPRVELVTITGVEMESNLRTARVYYSVQGDEQAQTTAYKGLQSAKGYIKRELSKILSLRFMPELIFEFDTSFDRGQRIMNLLDERHDKIQSRKDN